MEIEFYPVEVSYKLVSGSAVIQLFGRASDGSRICVLDESFEPYFWVLGASAKEISKLEVPKQDGVAKIRRAETFQKKFIGKDVVAVKAFAQIPSDVPILRQAIFAIGQPLEADIPFERRYLIDKGISPLSLCKAEGEFINSRAKVPVFKATSVSAAGEQSLEKLKVLSVDIETHSKFGDAISPQAAPIIMLGLAGDGLKKVITWKRFVTDLPYVEFVDSEVELIERFKQILDEFGPDVITGYFSDGFDFPYLEARAEKYKMQLDIGLDFSGIRIRKSASSAIVRIPGISHFDCFKFVKSTFWRSMESTSYDLDTVSAEILGDRKVKVDLSTLYDAWQNNEGLESFCAYNMHDADLTFRLAEKLLPNVTELVKIIGLGIDDVSRMSFSQLVEWYLIGQAKNFNELAPNRPAFTESRDRLDNTFSGAFVYEPTPGLYNDIVVFDFRSLYPTIISAHNISPDMMNCVCCGNDLVPQMGAKRWFCQKRSGFISTVIEDIIRRRMRIKEIMKTAEDTRMLKARAEGLKTIANSMYGYTGFFGARWYSIECAQSITAYGRNYITMVIDRAKAEGFRVLYSDTDSIFLSLSGKTKKNALEFVESVNLSLPGLMELDFEGYYVCGLFVATKDKGGGAKKKYALLSEEGTMKVKGFESVRRNLSKVAKESQQRVLDIILREQDVAKATTYIKQVVEDLRSHEIPITKVIINIQLQKEIARYDNVSPHVAVAQRMRQAGKDVGSGMMVSYVVISGKDKIRDRARLPDEVKQNEYDAEYYIFNQVLPSVEKIFEVFSSNISELVESKKQMKLDRFFA